MASSQNLYDPERIKNIGEIMPGLLSYARVGDEIALGLKGDPAFPDVYRGSRPTGVITDITRNNDETIVTANVDGEIMKLPSNTIGAYNTWEFTSKGFEKVRQREEIKASRAESELRNQEYRGVSSLEERVSQIEKSLRDIQSTNQTFRSTVVSTFNNICKEVDKVAESQGLNTQFCGTLSRKYNQHVKSRSEKTFRGTESNTDQDSDSDGSDDSDDSAKNSVASMNSENARSEKLYFSDEDKASYNGSDDD